MMDVALQGVGAVIPTSRRLRFVDLNFHQDKDVRSKARCNKISFSFYP